MSNWFMFTRCADEWLMNYWIATPLASVRQFSVGHALELYLKAAVAKIEGEKEAMAAGHNVLRLWKKCKEDPMFIPGYKLSEVILSKPDLFSGRPLKEFLSAIEVSEFESNSELYMIAKFLPDLKYLGTTPKAAKGGEYMLSVTCPNLYWIPFFKALRTYLGIHTGPHDTVKALIRTKRLPDQAISALEEMYA